MRLAGRNLRMPSLRYVLFVISILLLIAGCIIVWWNGARHTAVGKNFSYSADIVAADNYYNQAAGRYSGEEYSNGKFYVQETSTEGGISTVGTTLNVRSLAGQTIANTTQQLKLTANAGKIAGSSNVYMFAPPGLHKGQDFTGRYALYTQPAHMHYSGTDIIYGLSVYRYQAEWPTADRLVASGIPTAGLKPGQTAVFHPNIQIWVEPLTGWLIKIEDNTTIDVADAKTGKTIAPYNKFSAHYSDDSIRQQVAYATNLKYQVDFAQHIAPSAVFLLLLLFPLLWFVRHLRMHRILPYMATAVTALGIVLADIGWTFNYWPLMTALTGKVAINPVAIITFSLTLFCIYLLHRRSSRWLSGTIALLVALTGIVTMAGILHIIGFRLDELIAHTTIVTMTGVRPSQLSLHDAGMFILLGLGMARIAFRRDSAGLHISTFLASIVLVFNVASLVVQFLQIDQQFSITFLYPLSASMSILFISCAYLVLFIARRFRNVAAATGMPMLRQLVRPVFISLPIICIAIIAQSRQNIVNDTLRTTFATQVTNIQTQLADQLDVYKATLIGTQALFAASHTVEANEWRTYIADYSSGSLIHGIETIGYAPVVSASQSKPFSAMARNADGLPFTIFPLTQDATITPVRYVNPPSALATQQRGYDLSSNEVIAKALAQATDSGVTTMTDKLHLSDIPGDPKQAGLLMALPVYMHDLPTTTAAERTKAVNGYVFATIGVQDLVANAIGAEQHTVDFQIYDGNLVDSEALLYDNRQQPIDSSYVPSLTQTITISVLDHPWTIAFEASPNFHLSGDQEQLPNIILVAGSLTYLVVAGVIYWIIIYKRQTRTIEAQHVSRRQRQ